MRLEREARILAAAWQSERQLRQQLGDGGLASGRNFDDMRNRLKTLGALVWGTKAQQWHRVVHAEARRNFRNQTNLGLQTVPENSRKQEDKDNSVCH